MVSVQDIRVIATRLKKLDAYQRGLLPFQKIPLEDYLVDENLQMIVEAAWAVLQKISP